MSLLITHLARSSHSEQARPQHLWIGHEASEIDFVAARGE